MPKWWACINTDCVAFEKLASSDEQPKCHECKEPMRFVIEEDVDVPEIERQRL